MNKLYRECFDVIRDISALGAASGVIGWDQETMMPPKAAGARAEQSSVLASIIHEKFTSPKIGRMLRKLSKDGIKLSSIEKANVRETLIDYNKSTCLPKDLVRDLARVGSLAQDAWIKARKKSDFKAFAPWLKEMVKLKRKQAKALGYKGEAYDALLDDYEPGMTTAELDPIVEEVRAGLVPIAKAIRASKEKINSSFLKVSFPEDSQEALCREAMNIVGVDADASRLDRSAHPFCCGIAPTDVRITTRYNARWMPQALYGVMHESGHALYEQGLDMKYYGTPMGEAVSLGIHESQSRLWENIVGRSLPFVQFMLPRMKKLFSNQLKGVKAKDFYRAVNTVKPSMIRVEADEVTYNLHIVMRYEIEKALIAGDIEVRDLPKIWNLKMKEYLGITPKNDAEGILQDTHWASGLFGYFPTYLLGNLYSAQFWAKLSGEVKNIEGKIAKGELAPIRAWLKKNIHHHGRRYSAAELVKRATGKPLAAKFFLDYLSTKYGDIYK
jgi:carboxypeptidase Taq